MQIAEHVQCREFPCQDVSHEGYTVPGVDVDPAGIRAVMIAEAPPADVGDYFYAPGEPLFAQTTLQAFADAGVSAHGGGSADAR